MRPQVEESMSFFSRIVRFIFWLLVVSWSVVLLKRAIGWMLRGAAGNPTQGTDELGAAQVSDTIRHLVRDPVCGTHVAEEVAIALREGGELVHFCSPACRDAYAGVAPKLAANG
jgi:YHS domain-containing protein